MPSQGAGCSGLEVHAQLLGASSPSSALLPVPASSSATPVSSVVPVSVPPVSPDSSVPPVSPAV